MRLPLVLAALALALYLLRPLGTYLLLGWASRQRRRALGREVQCVRDLMARRGYRWVPGKEAARG